MKLKSLKFDKIDRAMNGEIVRMTAEVDTWQKFFDAVPPTEIFLSDDDGHKEHHRIYQRYDICKTIEGEIFAASVSLNKSQFKVSSFEEGKRICQQWYEKFWTDLLEDIEYSIIDK